MPILITVPHCLDYCSSVVSLKSESMSLSTNFSGLFWLLLVLYISMNFRLTVKSQLECLIGIVLNLQISLGSTAILTIRSSNPSTHDDFPFTQIFLNSIQQCFLQFQCTSLILLLNVFLSILFFDAIINAIVLLIPFLDCSLLVHEFVFN